MNKNQNVNTGMVYAALAYLGWGFFPIYWKFLKHIPLLQIFSHRIIWAFVFYTCVLLYTERKLIFFNPVNIKTKLTLLLASVLLMGNWLVYIYAVNTNQIVESSLGYFINPLINILVGVFFLKEKLSKYQIFASLLAAIGVFIISVDQGHIPVMALFLAVTFSCYGLLKKLNPLPALKSNQFESMLMVPMALIYLLSQSTDWVTADNIKLSAVMLIGSGLVTGLPLIFFSEAAQRIPFYMMGFFQFLSPSLQFITGVFIFNETLSELKIKGFIFIWLAGLILLMNTWLGQRKKTS